ncbi:MAG: hypothetical protein JNL57_08070 [Bacteroidetes bacterium]|nr:hypothetical protein [Bacteroidota bacterium]
MSLILLRFLGFKGACQHIREHAPTNELPADYNPLNNAFFQVSPIRPYTIVFFVNNDCPLCKNYKPWIHHLEDSLRMDSMFGIMVVRTDLDSLNINGDYAAIEYGDMGKIPLHEIFKATVTPEVIVIAENGLVEYKGAIDNWAYDIGKHRTKATAFYLTDALQSLRKGEKPKVRETKAIGCFIENN